MVYDKWKSLCQDKSSAQRGNQKMEDYCYSQIHKCSSWVGEFSYLLKKESAL